MTLRRPATALALSALGAALLVGAAPAPSSAATATSAAPTTLAPSAVAGVPKVGQCYRYTVKQSGASASPTAPVACSAPHTAWTYFVGAFTGRAARIASPTSLQLDRPAMAACYAKRVAVFGSAVHLTRIRFAWFVPTPAQWAKGARFFRCDAVAEVGASSYELLPQRLPSVLASSAGRERLRACARTATGVRVPCTLSHDARAVAWLTLAPSSAPYPGPAAIEPLVRSRCTAALAALPGAPALAWYSWPMAASWSAGHHVATCFAADPPAPTG